MAEPTIAELMDFVHQMEGPQDPPVKLVPKGSSRQSINASGYVVISFKLEADHNVEMGICLCCTSCPGVDGADAFIVTQLVQPTTMSKLLTALWNHEAEMHP